MSAAEDGDGKDVAATRKEGQHIWAQRCKLYIYRSNAKMWVQIGTGKGALVRSGLTEKVEFVFEEEELKIMMAKHMIDTACSPQRNSGTDKGWSWTAFDTIQKHEKQGEQWFTAKFATPAAAFSFKDAFDRLREDPTLLELPPPEAHEVASSVAGSVGPTSTALLKLLPGSPTSSPPVSPSLVSRMSRSEIVPLSIQAPPNKVLVEAWLLYFEKGTLKEGTKVRETSTIYIGAYDTKEQALVCAVRAMDLHSDRSKPWRVRTCWDKLEDRRQIVGDKGVIISVTRNDGAFNHVKLRRMPFNLDLPVSGLPEGDDLWDI